MVKKRVPIFAVVLIVVFAIIITFQISTIAAWTSFRNQETEKQKVTDDTTAGENVAMEKTKEKLSLISDIYDEYYIGDLDDEEIENWTIQGYIVGTGDKYGEYMDPETFKEFQEQTEGENQGIGVSVIEDEETGLIKIIDVSENTPADKAGIQKGDLVITVEGMDCYELGYDASLAKMQGKAGTTAKFSIYRDGEILNFSLVREKFEAMVVGYHMYEDGVTGIVKITTFNDVTAEQFINAVTDLQNQGAERFVFDVRSNLGGTLDSVSAVLDFLVPEGPVIRITNYAGEESVIESDANELDAPIAVLTNQATASAAELFTATLRDYNKSITVGMNTYGKGSMQTIVGFDDGSALRISYSMYSPPISENYDGVGIKPDIEVELDESLWKKNFYAIKDTEDNQLQAALKALDEKSN